MAEKQKVLDALKIYVERIEKPFNYMTFEEDEEKVRREKVRTEQEWKEQDKKQKNKIEEGLELELRKQKKAQKEARRE